MKEKDIIKRIKEAKTFEEIGEIVDSFYRESSTNSHLEDQLDALLGIKDQVQALYNSIIYLQNWGIDNVILINKTADLLREVDALIERKEEEIDGTDNNK